MPKKTVVRLASAFDEVLEVEAELTTTEGLVVHRSPAPGSKVWHVTHAPSGYMVTWARTKREAREIAAELGLRLLGGWNRDIDPNDKAERNAALKALRGVIDTLYPDGEGRFSPRKDR